ncbi:MAG: hypothetical protein E6593_04745 [Clostridium sp.]|nr:hypothetical protein [Clostridium sp.]
MSTCQREGCISHPCDFECFPVPQVSRYDETGVQSDLALRILQMNSANQILYKKRKRNLHQAPLNFPVLRHQTARVTLLERKQRVQA